MAFVEVRPWHGAMNFAIEVVKPRVRFDEGPEILLPTWAAWIIELPAGRHTVEMFTVWGMWTHFGRNRVEVDVPETGVQVSWKVPNAAWAKGKMEVAAPGTGLTAPPLVLGPPAGSAHPPAWLVDPSGRHQFRWWDGTGWTPGVSSGGVQGTDPL